MDPEGPQALCDLCLAQVCCSLEALCSKRADGSMSLIWVPLFPPELADRLLQAMASKAMLNDATVGIFRDSKELRLRRASIRRCVMSAEAFRLALCPHRLLELDASWASEGLTGASVVSGLVSSPACRLSLQKLSLSGLHLDWGSLEDGCVGFSSLRGLKTLHLASTDLTDDILEDVCSLPHLESLDISCTPISKLSALLQCKNSLRSLIAHRLRQLNMSPSRLFFVLSQLDALRHLDFSDDHFGADDLDGRDGDEVARQLLEGSSQILPSLVSLDLSGRKAISEAALAAFVESRRGLLFLGLLDTGLSSSHVLTAQRNLKVTGEANENQVCEALGRYTERECFVQKALLHLYRLTTDADRAQPDTLKLVLSAMKSHPSSLQVHLVATACVFNLTTQDLAEAMPVTLISSAIAQLLHAMKTFPNHQQVQKNCLLALCSDYILQDIPFDRYLAAMLVINWLSNHEDATLQRNGRGCHLHSGGKEETGKLSQDVVFMKQLLAIVQQKAMVGVVDSTLKFALSALWNLTDEMPSAARSFIQCQGLELYEEVLESYYNEPTIQQKILGLLNNIAEVKELQADLMDEDLLEHILILLKDTQVEVGVRYFAGGILAHLSFQSRGLDLGPRAPGGYPKAAARVDYNLAASREGDGVLQPPAADSPAVRSAAVGSLGHTSGLQSKHSMLEKDGVTELLKALAAHPDTHDDIKRLVGSILCMVEGGAQRS
ncbi:zyg-11-like protein [Oryzias melastigma]|uniref:Zyg-11-like protein n=1 Tax=Oryzias melastigma TaxID=30732 RepID=A0A834C4J6_ORYME|nr:zyg-11-like protein [Oryzias melastigma]